MFGVRDMKKNIELNNRIINVHTLGYSKCTDENDNLIKLKNQRVYDVFFYLFHHFGHPVSRDQIMFDLFPHLDIEEAKTSFHTVLYQLRKDLAKYGMKDVVKYESGGYILNVRVVSDIDKLETLLSTAQSDKTMMKILEIYKGKYFESTYYSWAIQKQQEIHSNIIYWISVGLDNYDFSTLLINRILATFRDDCLGSCEILHQIILNFKNKKDLFQIKKLLIETEKYWKEELDITFPYKEFKKYIE